MSKPVRLGPFLLGELLGEGGMGTVWRARHPEGVDVAVKVLKPSWGVDPQALRAFRAEVRAVASLDHPHIVRVFDYGVVPEATAASGGGALAAGSPWLAMACAPDGTLADVQHVDSWSELLLVLQQVLDALAHSHARGIVHRDLKPRNVLLTLGDEPSVTLTDFGIAHAVSRANAQHAQAGTPGYMAPEQIRGEWRTIGGWSDLYSLGCLVYRLCTGRPPFHARTRTHVLRGHLLSEPPRLVTPFPVPSGFEDWVRQLLAKEAAHRFLAAADAASALATLTTGAVSTAPPRDWRPRHPPTVRRPVGTGLAMFVLRPWPLVGRDEVQDRMWRALVEAAEQRRPRLLILEGAPGSGRSRLLHWLIERSSEAGLADGLILRGGGPRDRLRRHLRLEGAEPDEALATLRCWLARHDSPAPDSEAVELERELSASGQPWTWEPLFDRLTARRAAVVGFDDADEADAASRDLLLRALASGTPTLVVATRRPGGASWLPDGAVLALDALGDDGQRSLVDAGGGLAPHLARQVVSRTSGNPGLAVRLVAEWARQGSLVPTSLGFDLRASRASIPPAVSRELDDRIEPFARAHPDAAAALYPLAVLGGRRVRQDEWEQACAEGGRPWVVEPAVAEGLLRSEADPRSPRWSLEPPLLADALRARLAASGELSATHLAAARALIVQPRAAARENAAAHFFAAGRPEEARSALRHLADEALHHGLLDRLAPLLEQEGRVLEALDLDEGHPAVLRWRIDGHQLSVLGGAGRADPEALVAGRRSESPEVVAAAWRASLRAGDLSDPDEAGRALTAAGDGRGLRLLHLARARALGTGGDLAGAIGACDQGLATLTGAPDGSDRDRLLEERAHWLVRHAHPDAEGAASAARESCLARGRPAQAAEWLAWRARFRRMRGALGEAAELSIRAQQELRAAGADTAPADLELALAQVALGQRDRAGPTFAGIAESCSEPERRAVARAGWMVCADPRTPGFEALLDEPIPASDPEAARLLEQVGQHALRAGSRGLAVRALERAAEIYLLQGDRGAHHRVRNRVPRT